MIIEVDKHQKSFRIKKSFKELVQKPKLSSKNYQINLPPLPPYDKNTLEYAYDVLYECQRGSLAVGYSSKTLLQFDPNPWCDIDMRFTPMNIENYQLPDPTWEWASKNWMIDMTEDVDEAGWQYALKFHGADWHGNYKHFRSFVRRRRWIRLRSRKIFKDIETIIIQPSENVLNNDNHNYILEKLKKCRLDRERLVILNDFIKSTLTGLEDIILEKAPEYMNFFDYDTSKIKFISILLKQKYTKSNGKLKLTPEELKAIKTIRFYHDIQTLLNEIDPQLKQ